MKISFMNWTSKSILVASVLCVSAVAQAQDQVNATYMAAADAYAVVVRNDLSGRLANIEFDPVAFEGETRIRDIIYVIGGPNNIGKDLVVRANSDYTLDIKVPTLPHDSGCQPAFFQPEVTTFGAVGELVISMQDALVLFDDQGFNFQTSSNPDATAVVSATISCGEGEATISLGVDQTAGTSVDTFTFGLGFLPDGARDDSGASYGAQGEPPAGTYSLSLAASLYVGLPMP